MQAQTPSVITNQNIQNLSFNNVLNGNVSIGSPLTYDSAGVPATFSQDNGDGILIRVASVANPEGLPQAWAGNNVSTTITHNLGRVPIGYYVTKKTGPCDVYDGSSTPTSSAITLCCTTGVDTVIYIF
jgi:hypothetical protein